MTADHAHGHSRGHPGESAHGVDWGKQFDSHFGPIDLTDANTRTPPGWGKLAMLVLAVIGLACVGATAAFGFMKLGDDAEFAAKQAWHAYHVGVIVALGLMLGCLALTLIFRAVQAGWATSFRRVCENVASLLPFSAVLVIPYIFAGKKIWKWMDPAMSGDAILKWKADYLNPTGLWLRLAVYIVVWSVLGLLMRRLSTQQDATGDKTLTNKAQFHAAWGLLVFALSTTFAAFDLVMSMDYHWFSTMFGVYFFAGNILSGVSLTVLLILALRKAGVLRGIVTNEHLHDLGKLTLAFTVFWAYIGFSQYFLIWYANIPEETAWMLARKTNGWEVIGKTLMVGHFILPFLILLWRGVKRTPMLLGFVCSWQLVMHVLDVFWQIRANTFLAGNFGNPEVAAGKIGFNWVDITGVLGPVCLLLALIIWRMGTGYIVPIRDPRLNEALNHKNYV